MSKEIEEGCRAVIVNSVAGNNGIIVRVGKYVGDSPLVDGILYYSGNRWEIDKAITTTKGNLHSHVAECKLQRIDDHDDKEELGSWEELKHIWNPETVGA